MIVKVDNTGPKTVITVTVDTGKSGLTVQSIDEFGYGVSKQVSSVSCTPTNCNTNWALGKQGSKTLAGYGDFLNSVQLTKGMKNDTSVTFTLSSLVTSFSPSEEGIPSYFAAHILFTGTIQGCKSDSRQISPQNEDDQQCKNPTGFWGGSILVAPEFPLGTVVSVVTPLAAIGAYFGLKKFVLARPLLN